MRIHSYTICFTGVAWGMYDRTSVYESLSVFFFLSLSLYHSATVIIATTRTCAYSTRSYTMSHTAVTV